MPFDYYNVAGTAYIRTAEPESNFIFQTGFPMSLRPPVL